MVLPLKTALYLLLIPFLDTHMAVRQLIGKNKILSSFTGTIQFPPLLIGNFACVRPVKGVEDRNVHIKGERKV